MGCVKNRGRLCESTRQRQHTDLCDAGDVNALADVYLNRQPFPFIDHFAALRAMSGSTVPLRRSSSGSGGDSARGLPVPQALFVASDSTNLDEEVAAELKRAPAAWGAVLGLPGPLADPPPLLSVDQNQRFVAQHGSHTVSSEGACTAAGECGLPWQEIIRYKAELARTGACHWK